MFRTMLDINHVHSFIRAFQSFTPDTPKDNFDEQYLRHADIRRLLHKAVLCSVDDSNYLTGTQTVLGSSKTTRYQIIRVLHK